MTLLWSETITPWWGEAMINSRVEWFCHHISLSSVNIDINWLILFTCYITDNQQAMSNYMKLPRKKESDKQRQDADTDVFLARKKFHKVGLVNINFQCKFVNQPKICGQSEINNMHPKLKLFEIKKNLKWLYCWSYYNKYILVVV